MCNCSRVKPVREYVRSPINVQHAGVCMSASTLSEELEPIVAKAAAAAPILARTTPEERARALVAAAQALEAAGPLLVPIAIEETGLGEARLTGEVTRTALQLRMFAETVVQGAYLNPRIDEVDPAFALGVRPDVRRTHVPLGPIINFAASNFPFAFSVAGGDSAAALAAGCPVILKAHSGHPKLSDATGDVIREALHGAGMPEGVFQVIHGQDEGTAVLKDPRIKGGSFTGSIYVGRLLADIAAARPTPIPFYGELGSVNPVFISHAALEERAQMIAEGYVTSVSGSAGQLCTKPGFLFVPEDHGIAGHIEHAANQVSEHRLLGPRIAQSYAERRAAILDVPGVHALHEGGIRFDDEGQGFATPTIVSLSLATLREHRKTLIEEVFGPMSLIIEVPHEEPYAPLMAELFEGNLTGTLHLSEAEKTGDTENVNDIRDLIEVIILQVGRVLFDSWPTGVAVTPAMTHGGPWPATTNDSSTSVGSAAIERFQRPITYQNVAQVFLPAELRDDNPRDVIQQIAAAGDSTSWGARFA